MSSTTTTATGRATALYAPAATTAPPSGIHPGNALDTVRYATSTPAMIMTMFVR